MNKILILLLFLIIPIVNEARVGDFSTGNEVIEDIYSVVRLADSGLAKEIFALAVKG